jgi:hypothetical protein
MDYNLLGLVTWCCCSRGIRAQQFTAGTTASRRECLVSYFTIQRVASTLPIPLPLPQTDKTIFLLILQVSLYLLITAQLNVIRRTWSLYVAIKYQINKQPDIEIPEYVDLVCAILYTSVTVLMFSILVAISRKEAGLRS